MLQTSGNQVKPKGGFVKNPVKEGLRIEEKDTGRLDGQAGRCQGQGSLGSTTEVRSGGSWPWWALLPAPPEFRISIRIPNKT